MRTPINGCCSSPRAARRSARRSGVCRKPAPTAKGTRAGQPAAGTGPGHASPPCCRCRRMKTLWDSLHLVFATASGNVRRNRLSDFRNVRAAGLIAMKLDEGDRLIGVATCREGDDVMLATRKGRCIRFQITDDTLRVFAGRDSSGVRGIRLVAGDEVIEPLGAAPCRRRHRGARGLSAASPTRSAARNGDRRRGRTRPIRDEARGGGDAFGRAHRRSGSSRGIPADRHQCRFRQAHLGLRVPGHRAGRAGDRQHHAGTAQWRRRGRDLPGAAGRRS